MAFEAYIIRNTINGKCYVGITSVGVSKRWAKHLHAAKRGSKNYALYGAISKYGPDAFVAEHIGSATTFENLLAFEIMLIAQHRTRSPDGYNLTAGGEGMLGFAFTKETRARMSLSHLGHKPKPESVEKTRLAITGKPKTQEHNKKVADRKRLWWAQKDTQYKNQLAERIRRGQNHHIVTEEQVAEVKLNILIGHKNREITRLTGVSAAHVACIRYGKIWKLVPPRGFSEGLLYGGL